MGIFMNEFDDIVGMVKRELSGTPASLTIDPARFKGKLVGDFLKTVLGVDQLRITNPVEVEDLDNERYSFRGESELAGISALLTTLTVQVSEDATVLTIKCMYKHDVLLSMQPLHWLKFRRPGFEYSMENEFGIVDEVMYFSIAIEDSDDLIDLRLAKGEAQSWTVSSAISGEQSLDAAEDLLKLSGISAHGFTMPSVLKKILCSINVKRIASQFSFVEGTIDYFTVDISIDKELTLLKNVIELKEIEDLIFTLEDLTTDDRSLRCRINATFDLGPKGKAITLPVFTEAGIHKGTDHQTELDWTVGLQPGETATLPSVKHILDMIAGDKAVIQLPDIITKSPSLELELFQVDTVNGKIENLYFATSFSKWPILKDYFVIDSVSFKLILKNLSGKKDISGSIKGVFELISSVYIFCEVDKLPDNGDWIIKGGIAPGTSIEVTEIAEQYLKGGDISFPKAIPAVSINDLLLSIDLTKKEFLFEAVIAEKWPLAQQFSTEIGLRFSRTVGERDGKPVYHAAIWTIIQISKYEFDIRAELVKEETAKLTLEGETKPGQDIPVGELFGEVWSKFIGDGSGGGASCPKIIEKITIDNVGLMISTGTQPEIAAHCEVKFHFAQTEMDIQVSLHVVKKPKQYDIDALGIMKILKDQRPQKDELCEFKLEFHKGADATKMTAMWVAEEKENPFNIQNLVGLIDKQNALPIPAALNLALEAVVFNYDSADSSVVLAAVAQDFGDAFFITCAQDETPKDDSASMRAFVFGVELQGPLRLSQIPIIGEALKDLDIISLEDLRFTIATHDVTDYKMPDLSKEKEKTKSGIVKADDTEKKNSSFPDKISASQGVEISSTLKVGEFSLDFDLPIYRPTDKPKTKVASNALAAGDEKPSDEVKATNDIHWIKLQKTLGVLHFQRLGVQFKSGDGNNGDSDNRISLLLDSGIGATGFALDLYGLSLSFTPTGDLTKAHPTFGLQGISAALSTGPVKISAGFLRTQIPDKPDLWYYNGEAQIIVSEYGFSGIGSFSVDEKNHPSMVIAGFIGVPIGPPQIQISGFALGCGFNRRANIPTAEKLGDFPLIKMAQGKPQTLREISDPFPMDYGNFWVAAGIRFTALELINGLIIGLLGGGTQFEVALIGNASVMIPGAPSDTGESEESAIPTSIGLYIEFDLEACFALDSGMLSFSGSFSKDSYILIKGIKMEGGFALCTWLTGDEDRHGDFVFTIGGYHPKFKAPAYYPQIKPIGINWNVSDYLVIKGNRYMALTPSCVMFGGALECDFTYKELKACLQLLADFLIAWSPFAFDGEVKATVSIHYKLSFIVTKTINLNLGADLHVWGPRLCGEVKINLKVISFNVRFGDDLRPGYNYISWDKFKQDYLKIVPPKKNQAMVMAAANEYFAGDEQGDPNDSQICQAFVSKGLIKDIKSGDKTVDKPEESVQETVGWVVTPGALAIQATTRIPAKNASFNGQPLDSSLQTWSIDFTVGMINIPKGGDFTSSFSVDLRDANNTACTGLTVKTITGNVPKAMWDDSELTITNAGGKDAQIANTLKGFNLYVGILPSDKTQSISLKQLMIDPDDHKFKEETNLKHLHPVSKGQLRPDGDALIQKINSVIKQASSMDVMIQTISDNDVANQRKNTLQTLANPQYGFNIDPTVNIMHLNQQGKHDLLAAPTLCSWY